MAFFVIDEWVKERNLVLRTWTIRKCPFCAFYKYLRLQLYRYAYTFGLSSFIVHKISNGYAMIYFYVIDIMMRKSISSFTIYADNIKNFGIPIWCLISYITLVKCNKNQLRLNLAFHENNERK